MAVKTFMLGATLTDGSNNTPLVDGVDQTAATLVLGWTVAKVAATNSSYFTPGAKSASGTFSLESGNPKPTGTFGAEAMVTPVLTGTFAATTWTFTFAFRATTAASQAGRIRMRVLKADNLGRNSPTTLTSAVQVGTTSAALTTTADATSVVTWSPGTTFTLTAEYLFFSLAWEITTASGSNSGDVAFRTGQASGGTRIVTPDLSAGAAEVIPDVGMALTVT